jgi:peptidoglycan/LPS O-acetylase OafA/YrhL
MIKRVPELDGLRGIAIAMVLVSHIWIGRLWDSEPIGYWPNVLLHLAGHGVDLFFVLSGFLIGGILMDHARSPRLFSVFYLRRAFRILPAYWLLILSFVVAVPVDAHARFGLLNYLYDPNPLPVWRYVLFVQNFVTAWTRSIDPVWLAATWSLAVEEQFYLIVPWFIRYLSRHLAALCVAGVVTSLCVRYYYIYCAQGNICAADNLIVSRTDALCVGILVAIVSRGSATGPWLQARPSWLRAGLLASAILYIGLPLADPGRVSDAVYHPTLYALANGLVLLHVVHAPAGALVGILRARFLVWLGGISYFVYLFHLPVNFVVRTFLGKYLTGPDGLAVALSTGVVFLAAWASRRWFEQPLIRYSRRFSY